jgi:uncharacterized protein YndB with AHSA1/START domain
MTTQIIDENICISAPVDIVWDALTNPEHTEKYWGGIRIESHWTKGAKVFYRLDGKIMDEHELLEIVPYRLIEHTFNPTFGDFKDEPPSLVSIILSKQGQDTQITVLHRNFPPESKVYSACSQGWPEILKSLKSYLGNSDQV